GQSGRYNHTRIGVGGRMDSIQCAVVLAKLGRFDWELERRAALGRRYDQLLAPLAPRVRPIKVRPDRTSVYAQYTVRQRSRAPGAGAQAPRHPDGGALSAVAAPAARLRRRVQGPVVSRRREARPRS